MLKIDLCNIIFEAKQNVKLSKQQGIKFKLILKAQIKKIIRLNRKKYYLFITQLLHLQEAIQIIFIQQLITIYLFRFANYIAQQNIINKVPILNFYKLKIMNTPYKSDKSFYSKSTADKFYDLEQTYKQYEELMEENIQLRNILYKQKQNFQPSEQSRQKIAYETSTFDQEQLSFRYMNQSDNKNRTYNSSMNQTNQKSSDMILWGMKKRNQFLQNKIDRLKQQYENQVNLIRTVQISDKWKKRFNCTQNSCYEHKYIQLLRVKSPLF